MYRPLNHKNLPEAEYVHQANDKILIYQEDVLKIVPAGRLVEQATRVDVAGLQSMIFEQNAEINKLTAEVHKLKQTIRNKPKPTVNINLKENE